MKRILLFLFLTLAATTPCDAQESQSAGHTSINALLKLQRGTCQRNDDGVFIFIPIPPSKPGVPKAPVEPVVIGYDANNIYTFGMLEEYTLYIIRDYETIYQVTVNTSDGILPLPVELYEDCLLFFVSERDAQCYYGEVREGMLFDVDADNQSPYLVNTPFDVDYYTLLLNHVKIISGGILTISDYLLCHSSVVITIEGNGQLIVDGGIISNVRIDLRDDARLVLRNNGVIAMRAGTELNGGRIVIESGTITSWKIGE